MNENVDWELLAKYFAGECAARETAAVRIWRAADGRHAELMAELRQLWQAVEHEDEQEVDLRAAWQALDERLHQEEDRLAPAPHHAARPRQERSPRPARRPQRTRKPRDRRRFFRMGAGVLVVAVVTLLAALLARPSLLDALTPGASGATYVAERGQRTTIELADGTRVYLNAGSRLSLAPEFAEGNRTVHLEGEAYFDVADDPTHPFRVRTEQATVQVVGTIFDVRAYPDEKETTVAVAEGTVTLHTARSAGASDPGTAVVLRPHHLGVVSNRGLQTVRRDVELAPHLAWTEGKLLFRNASFEEVARRLERWYDLRVEVRVAPEAIDALNASFDEAPLHAVLSDIAVALRLRYEKDGQTVTFYRRPAELPST